MRNLFLKFKKEILLVAVTAIVSIGASYYYFNSPSVKVSYPFIIKADKSKTSFACTGLVYSIVYANDGPTYQNKSISGELKTKSKDLDKLALELKGDTLELNTVAAIEHGNVTSESYKITQNSNDRLTAIIDLSNETGVRRISIFVLNKDTGLAVWNETADNFPAKSPYGSSEYFHCL